MENIERKKWIDVSRGILIILVVFGHSIPSTLTGLRDYIYQFHMPAFFIISGFLYKEPDDTNSIYSIIKKRTKRLLIPYLSYLIIISIVRQIILYYNSNSLELVLKDIYNTIYGGQYLGKMVSILWFLTCLLFVQIIFLLINKFIKKFEIRVIMIFIMYIIAHMQAWYFNGKAAPWAIDIGFIAIFYYSFGHYFRNIIINKHTFMISALLVITYTMLSLIGQEKYVFELWGHRYTNFTLDAIIPISYSLFILNISNFIANYRLSNILADIGKNSLPIMCLQGVTISIAVMIFGKCGMLLYTVIGVVPPYLISKFILSRSKLLRKMFIG